MSDMTSNRPYLVRAYYDWIVDNNCTPHLVVDANYPEVVVPQEHIQDGQIVLNISPTACGNLVIGEIDIEFDARFSGVPRHLIVPAGAVLAIYARENGAGTMFPREEPTKAEETAPEKKELGSVRSVDTNTQDPDTKDDEPPKPPKGKPTLKVVK